MSMVVVAVGGGAAWPWSSWPWAAARHALIASPWRRGHALHQPVVVVGWAERPRP
jgi:hypothetical protein